MFILLLSPSSYNSLQGRLVNLEISCSSQEQQLYLESQQTKKLVDQYPKKPSYPSQNSGLFYIKSREDLAGESFVLGAIHVICLPCCYKLPTKQKLFSVLQLFISTERKQKVLVTQSCLTLRPHRLQPTRLHCPRNSPDKNTGVGCHSLLQVSS